MAPAPAIGIDLGTTFSGAAVYRNGKTEIIPNKEGHHLTPSFVFYSPHSSNVAVGSTADDMSLKEIKNFLFDIKRIIGRKYDDVYIQKLKTNPEYKFPIVRGGNDTVEMELLHDNIPVHKTPQQVSSEILKYLRESASEYLGADVTEAVISIPARFSNAQRKATRAAAELAGLKVLKLITEPVAAAIHYAKERLDTKGTLLVFDFGGGTLDVSIIEADENSFKVKSVEGDTFLGGRDFDQILLQHFKNAMIRRFGPGIFSDRLLRRVKDACTRLKIKLSTENEYYLTINCIGGDENRDYTLGMSRTEFECLTNNLYDRVNYLVEKCITGAGLSKNDIDEVILVGGTTRMPKVRSMLRSYFNDNIVKTDLNPDEAVALGAAVQAAMIKEKSKDLEKYKVLEITPLSLGVNLMGGLMHVIIEKNTPIPVTSKSVKFATAKNNQKGAAFSIFEGERKMCQYNNFLGSIGLNDLPPGKAGSVTVETNFFLSEDGILEVEAYETSRNQKKKLAVVMGEYRLCENTINNTILDAEKNAMEDNVFEKFITFKTDVVTQCNHILYDLNNIPSITARQIVKEKCKQLENYSDTLMYTQIEELQNKYIAFNKSIKNLIKNYITVSDIFTSTFDIDSRLIPLVENMNVSSSSLSLRGSFSRRSFK